MTSKAVLKLAEDLLDRAFRDAEGQADRKVDLVLLVEAARSTIEKAEPALEYLRSRGLTHPLTGDGVYLTSRGVEAMATEEDIKSLPKFEQAWGGAAGGAAAAAAAVPETNLPPRPYRPMLSFIDPSGGVFTFELGWLATVGRSDEATLTLPDPRASKRHVELKYAGDHYVVRDLGSANGTMVNGGYVEVHALAHGDVLLVGRTEVTYTCPEVLPEPADQPPSDVVSSRAPAPTGEPTARPVRGEAPVMAPARPSPRPPSDVGRRPEPVREAPRAEPVREPPRAEPPRAEPVREAPRAEPPRVVERPRPTPPSITRGTPVAPAPAPPGAAGRRRTAGSPVASAEVPIVKGRPEAPPSAGVADDSGLFSSADRPSGDLFGDAPTRVPPVGRAAPAAAPGDLFSEEATTTAPGVSREDVMRGKPAGVDLFAPTMDAPVAGEGDLFQAGANPSAPDLFAQKQKREGADLFAPRHDQRPSDLFAPNYGGGGAPVRAPDLFDGSAQPAEDAVGDTMVRGGGVSPMPLGVSARAPQDLLPLDDEPDLQDVIIDEPEMVPLEPEPIIALDQPLEESPGEDATIAGMSPLLAPPPAATTDSTVTLAPDAPTGRTDELPAWGRADGAQSLAPFAPADEPEELLIDEAPLMVGPPDASGGFDERTPVEDGPTPAAPDQILAASTELPEAPSSLEDAPLEGELVPYASFVETLMVLRTRIAEAGVPDQARLVDAIDVLRKHPSVRAALTDP